MVHLYRAYITIPPAPLNHNHKFWTIERFQTSFASCYWGNFLDIDVGFTPPPPPQFKNTDCSVFRFQQGTVLVDNDVSHKFILKVVLYISHSIFRLIIWFRDALFRWAFSGYFAMAAKWTVYWKPVDSFMVRNQMVSEIHSLKLYPVS